MTEYVPKSDIMGVGEIVELCQNQAIVENERGKQYIFSEETYRNPNMNLTKLFKLYDKIAFKADRRKQNSFTKNIYIVTFVRKLNECISGFGTICELHPTYGLIKEHAKTQGKKIFFPAMAFGDTKADYFYNKIKDCTKFFRVNDPVSYLAVEESSTSKCLYGIHFDLNLNGDDKKPLVGIVVEICKEFCRVWIKNRDALRINCNEIFTGLVDVKKVLEIGSRIEFSCDNYPKIENVRLLDAVAKIRLENYKKFQLSNKKTEGTEQYDDENCYEDIYETENKSGDVYKEDETMYATPRISIKALATVKTIKPTYAVLYSEKVGDVLVLVSDWLRYNKQKNPSYDVKNEKRNGFTTSKVEIDLTDVLNEGELMYFEGYFYHGTNRDGFRANRVEKTIQGRGVLQRIHETYAFLFAPVLNEDMFFAGAALLDDFCGLKNLDKTLRLGDEVGFVAIFESDYHSRYKAIAVAVPNMGKENDDSCVGIVVNIDDDGAKLYCRPLGEVYLQFRSNATSAHLKIGQRLRFLCKRLGGRYEAIDGFDILPEEFVLKFPDHSPIRKIGTANSNGEDIENKINVAIECNKTQEHVDEAHFPNNNDVEIDRFSNLNGVENDRFLNNKVVDVDNIERHNGEDVCWSDLEKELEELTCDVTQRKTLFPNKFEEVRADDVVMQPVCDIFGPQPTFDEGTDDIFQRIRSCSNEIFKTDSLFTPFFVSPNAQNGNEKDIWNEFSHSNSLELSQTETSLNEELVQTSSTSTQKCFVEQNLSPIFSAESSSMAAVIEKKDFACQTSFTDEKDILKKLLKDDKIFELAATRHPSLVFEWSQFQRH